ncbi:MAG TPA: hypothetical protein VFC84_14515 [Desulfosporosinus sp.]|nr:hypothetical protein [Desulfosporosinus sp.]
MRAQQFNRPKPSSFQAYGEVPLLKWSPAPGGCDFAERTHSAESRQLRLLYEGKRGKGLSMDGLMSRCQGWQGATNIQNSPEVLPKLAS